MLSVHRSSVFCIALPWDSGADQCQLKPLAYARGFLKFENFQHGAALKFHGGIGFAAQAGPRLVTIVRT